MENLFKSLKPTIPKIIAIGKNYVKHVKEMGGQDVPKEPVIFTKPFTSIRTGNAPITIPSYMKEVHHEIELGFMIKKTGSNIQKKDYEQYLGGYFLALDLTDRDLQAHFKKEGFPWDLAKGFDGAMPVSSFIEKEKVKDSNNLELKLLINGKVVQNDNTSNMYYKIPFLIEYISKFMTLNPGDLIITGTPSGVGPIKPNDKVEAYLLQDGQQIASIITNAQNVSQENQPKL